MPIALTAFALALQTPAAVDPLLLNIGAKGQIQIKSGVITDLRTGEVVKPSDIAISARGHRFVYLGESHDRAKHHQLQADVIEALVADGRDVVVGFEMFTRPIQSQLNPWSLGWWTEAQFIANADWKGQWGFDYALYRPIFEATKKHRLPMTALNVPRDWVRRVGRQGPSGLTPEEQKQVPALDATNANHKAVFNALMGGHPMTGPQGDNIYSAQVLWDVGMADSALKYLADCSSNSKAVMVIVAGSGHVMYGQGINYRIFKRTGERGITVVMTESESSIKVSRGLGDFVYVSVK